MTDSAQTRAEGNNTAVTVADVRAAMDAAYPPALAESWDKVGLICGECAVDRAKHDPQQHIDLPRPRPQPRSCGLG